MPTGDQAGRRIAALIDFCRVMKGSAVGFRFLDHTDYSTGANHRGTNRDDVVFGYGDGVTTQFQLLKTYTVAGVTRTGEHPRSRSMGVGPVGEAAAISMGVLIAVAGTPTTSGWSVDTTAGMVTFTAAPTLGRADLGRVLRRALSLRDRVDDLPTSRCKATTTPDPRCPDHRLVGEAR